MDERVHSHVPSVAASASDSQRLIDQVARVAKQARRVMLIRAGGLWVVGLGIAVFCVVMLDVFTRPESLWFRWGSTIAVIGFACWGFVRWVLPVLRAKPSLVATARRIEASFPQLNDDLSTTIDLLTDRRAGDNKDLRQIAVQQSVRSLSGVSLQRSIDASAARTAWVGALALLACFALGMSLVPAMRWATVRLSVPFQDLHWPKRDSLKLSVPAMVHQGTVVLVTVEDQSPPLPSDLQLLTRPLSGTGVVSQRAEAIDKASRTYHWKLPIDEDLQVRAIGGDDKDAVWQTIRVIQPPSLAEHHVRVQPPDYAGLPEQLLSGFRFQVLAGSTIRLHVSFSVALQEVVLANANDGAPLDGLVAELGADHQEASFTLPDIQESHSVVVRWRDAHGLSGQTDESWAFQVVDDQPPIVQWLQPEQDIDVSTRAKIDLQWQAKDDVGLRLLRISSPGLPGNVLPDELSPQAEAALQSRTLEGQTTLDLSQLSGLHAGQSLLLIAQAEDVFRQVVKAERQIRLVADEAIEEFAAELFRRATTSAQQAVTSQSLATSEVVSASNLPVPDAINSLEVARTAQEQALQQTIHSPQAAQGLLDKAAKYLRRNQVSPEFADRLQAWSERFADLLDKGLRPASRELTALADELAASENASVLSAEQRSSLGELAEIQKRTQQNLEALVAEMTADDARRQAGFQLAELERRQRRLHEQTTASKNRGTDARPLAEQQRDLATGVAELIQDLKAMKEGLPAEAGQQLEEDAVATQMLLAANSLESNRVEDAEATQTEILEALKSSLSTMNGQAASERSADPWTNFVKVVNELQSKQQQLVTDLDRSPPAELAERERQLAQQSEALAEQVGIQPAFQKAMTAVVADLQTAAAGLERGRLDPLVRQAATDALERLKAIVDAAGQSAPSPKDDEPAEEASPDAQDSESRPNAGPTVESIRLWRNLQKWLHTETVAVEEQRKDRESVSKALEQRRSRLAAQQSSLAQEVREALMQRPAQQESNPP